MSDAKGNIAKGGAKGGGGAKKAKAKSGKVKAKSGKKDKPSGEDEGEERDTDAFAKLGEVLTHAQSKKKVAQVGKGKESDQPPKSIVSMTSYLIYYVLET